MLNQWNFDLPVRNGEEIEKVRTWKIALAFDLDPLGPIYVRINLQQESLSAYFFWAEQAATVNKVNKELSKLESKLQGLGVKVQHLDCRQSIVVA